MATKARLRDGVSSPSVLVCILSGVPLRARTRFALAARITTLASDLSNAGFEIRIVAPDGCWDRPPERPGLTHPDSPSGRRESAWFKSGSVGVLDSLRVILSSLWLLRRNPVDRPVVLLSTGVWLPFFSTVIAGLRPRTYVHLDVPGIPQGEVRLSKPRFWRAKSPLYKVIFSYSVRRSAIVTTINAHHARRLRDEHGVSALVIPDLLSEEWLQNLLALPPPTSGRPPSILYAGSLFGSRIDLFLRVLVRLTSQRGIRGVVVGDGPDFPRYVREFESENIEFPGYASRESLLMRLRTADICYSDVWSEIGTPYKLLEYMAAGRAIVSHDTGSLRETINDGVNGILCAKDEGALMKALIRLSEDPQLRSRLGAHARQQVAELHKGDRLRGLPEFYRRLVSVISVPPGS